MTRMAAGRTSHLTADEIAREARRQFDDAGGEPSIRSLAEALAVTPRAIYHYYANRNDIVEAVMALVWSDVFAEMAQDLDDPIHDRGDPVELFVLGARCARTVFLRHPALTSHLGMSARPSSFASGAIAVMGAALEDAGVSGEQAGRAVYTYTTYVFGSIMLEASRRRHLPEAPADAIGAPDSPGSTIRAQLPDDAPTITDSTIEAIDEVVSRDRTDDELNEQQFVDAVRHLMRSFVEPPGRAPEAG